jgi:Ala-tRNA(Pro) deacylase
MAAKVKHFLDDYRVSYRILHHERTQSLLEASHILEIDQTQVIKTILLQDNIGFVLAILPLQYQIDLTRVAHYLHRHFEIVACNESDKFFKDCEPGVHTPFGEIYGIPLILDNAIKKLKTVYIEVGSQNALVQLSLDDFEFLTAGAPHLSFATLDPSFKAEKLKTEVM